MKLKRFVAPKFWPIERKTKKFVIAPSPGPHPKDRCMPLGMILRDVLKCAETLKEAKEILNKNLVTIDGKIRKDHKFPIGLMDIISIGEESYRVLPNPKGISLKRIDDANIKLMRIENKICLKKKIQLNMHDGKNILVDEDDYKTGDVLIFDLEKKYFRLLRMKKGSIAMIIHGHNSGKVGKIDEIIVTRSHQPNQVKIKIGDDILIVPKNYVFVIGEEKPVIDYE